MNNPRNPKTREDIIEFLDKTKEKEEDEKVRGRRGKTNIVECYYHYSLPRPPHLWDSLSRAKMIWNPLLLIKQATTVNWRKHSHLHET